MFFGPFLALYFDGNFTFDEKVKILEFQASGKPFCVSLLSFPSVLPFCACMG